MLLADHLPEPEALDGEAFGHIERVCERDDFFGGEGDTLFALRGAMEGAPGVTFKAVSENLRLHTSS